jgi:hypothetical protein
MSYCVISVRIVAKGFQKSPNAFSLNVALKPYVLFLRSSNVSKCDGCTISGAKGREAATAQAAMLPSSGP